MFHLATGRDVGEPDLIGEGGDEFVAAGGEFFRGATFLRAETGKNQQPTIGKRLFPIWRDALWK